MKAEQVRDLLEQLTGQGRLSVNAIGGFEDAVNNIVVKVLAMNGLGSNSNAGAMVGNGDTLPSQVGNSGKFLTTNGASLSWGTPSGGSSSPTTPATQSGTTYTLQSTDFNTIIRFTSSSAITITLPATLAAGFYCTIVQMGSGQITFAAGSGASLTNRQNFTKTAGQYATASVIVDANSGGSAANFVLAGDCA